MLLRYLINDNDVKGKVYNHFTPGPSVHTGTSNRSSLSPTQASLVSYTSSTLPRVPYRPDWGVLSLHLTERGLVSRHVIFYTLIFRPQDGSSGHKKQG